MEDKCKVLANRLILQLNVCQKDRREDREDWEKEI